MAVFWGQESGLVFLVLYPIYKTQLDVNFRVDNP